MADWNVSKEATALLSDAHLWDMTVPWQSRGGPETQEHVLIRAADYGYSLASLTIGSDWEGMAGTMKAIAIQRAFFLANPDKYVLVDRFADIERAKKEGKLAIVLHFQGTNPVEGDIKLIEVYHRLGIRHMLMAYNMKNLVGDGCMERTNDGLSRFGVALVEEMNRVGMIVDVTHTGHRSAMDAFEVSSAPVIFSHSNPAAVWDIPRNVKDEAIKACAKTGGVMCINGVGVFMGDNDGSPAMMLKHINYVAELIGPENVGIGTDYVSDGWGREPFEARAATPADPAVGARQTTFGGRFNQMDLHQSAHLHASGGDSIGPDWRDIHYIGPEQMPELTELMLKQGYSEKEVRGILGENIMRVAKKIWN
jgi:membrane dipeptidase